MTDWDDDQAGKRSSVMLAGRSFLRPALLEATLATTAALAAVSMVGSGVRIACTSLIELGTLSVFAALSSAVLCVGYAGCARYAPLRTPSFVRWATRCRAAGYAGLAIYSAANAFLDIAAPRRDADPVSYAGLATAVVAVLVFALVWENKCRALDESHEPSLLLTLTDDAFFIIAGLLTGAALAMHIVAPVWWIDTTVSIAMCVLAALRLGSMLASRRLLSDE